LFPHDHYPSWNVAVVQERVDQPRPFCRGKSEHTSFAAQVGTKPNPKNNISKKHMMKALHFFLVLSLYHCLPSLPAAAHQKLKPDSDEVRRVLSKRQTQFLHTLHTKNGKIWKLGSIVAALPFFRLPPPHQSNTNNNSHDQEQQKQFCHVPLERAGQYSTASTTTDQHIDDKQQ
jgi:hypothetical protein